ncbi:hypothetical protein PV410_12665 [Streptomyces sp. PA03-5A]|nr:hypothetical protein [Streptomyces sp. PA03-5A]
MRLIGMPALTQAAGIRVASFNTVYEDNKWMRARLRRADGTGPEITGKLDDYTMRFSPATLEPPRVRPPTTTDGTPQPFVLS